MQTVFSAFAGWIAIATRAWEAFRVCISSKIGSRLTYFHELLGALFSVYYACLGRSESRFGAFSF